MQRFLYRVYFTIAPNTYYVVGGKNVKAAIRRAKCLRNALGLTSRKRPLKVAKVERLYRGGERQLTIRP